MNVTPYRAKEHYDGTCRVTDNHTLYVVSRGHDATKEEMLELIRVNLERMKDAYPDFDYDYMLMIPGRVFLGFLFLRVVDARVRNLLVGLRPDGKQHFVPATDNLEVSSRNCYRLEDDPELLKRGSVRAPFFELPPINGCSLRIVPYQCEIPDETHVRPNMLVVKGPYVHGHDELIYERFRLFSTSADHHAHAAAADHEHPEHLASLCRVPFDRCDSAAALPPRDPSVKTERLGDEAQYVVSFRGPYDALFAHAMLRFFEIGNALYRTRFYPASLRLAPFGRRDLIEEPMPIRRQRVVWINEVRGPPRRLPRRLGRIVDPQPEMDAGEA
jgi:hypothetical protein